MSSIGSVATNGDTHPLSPIASATSCARPQWTTGGGCLHCRTQRIWLQNLAGVLSKKSCGPAWLKRPKEEWPDDREEPEEVLELVRAMVVSEESKNQLIPAPTQFSTWERLVRNVACVYRMIKMLKRQAKRCAITQDELAEAEILVIKEAQGQMSRKEKEKLSAQCGTDGIWRMNGRLAAAPHLPDCTRFLIVLPKGHHVTYLLREFHHRHNAHSLDQRALNEFRKRYAVIHPRREINKVLKRCCKCRLQRAKPLRPEMAALPLCRVGYSCVHSHTREPMSSGPCG